MGVAAHATGIEGAAPRDTVADFLLKRLAAWGVDRIYGYPGDGINGILGALGRNPSMEFVQARHEELAALMACGHGKFSGRIGVCMATSGPGAVHLLNGLYDAKADHQPVLAIVGQAKRMSLGSDYQQEVDLLSLFKDVAHEYVQMATDPAQVRHLVDRAIRVATEKRTVTCLIFPNDVQELEAVAMPPREHGAVPSGIGELYRSSVPDDDALRRAADVLNRGDRVAILAGAGALHATDALIECAELLGAGIAKALLGKAAVPDDLPFVTGPIGILGSKPSWDLMSECDTLLMVGSAFPYSEFLPEPGQARGVQVDIDPAMLGLRYPMEVNLVGDANATLLALNRLLVRKEAREWRERVRGNVERWWRVLEKRALTPAEPVNPQLVFRELSSRLPDACIVTADSGTVTNWYSRHVKMRRGMMTSVSGGLATMGCGVPYALAAKLCHPARPVIALVGDGAMQMNGINGLITIARMWRQWRDPRLVVMVLNNRDLGEVTWEERLLGGTPKTPQTQDLPDFDYAGFARLTGLRGRRIERPRDVGAAWDEALAADRPMVLDFVTDPNVPPIPPHVTREQFRNFVKALRSGDADAVAVLKATANEAWAEQLAED
jgi:pyruvate dehydrogenase (quinone)